MTPTDLLAKLEEDLNVWHVTEGHGMHWGGHRIGWYWDRGIDDNSHGPFDSKAAALEDAALRARALPGGGK